MKVTLLLGSVRSERQSHQVANYLENMLQKRGIATDLIDLAQEPLPIYGSREEQASTFMPLIEAIGQRLQEADALLLITPEYHGSFSGALKNALDYYWVQFRKKPIGVVATSSGKMGGINASSQLQHVILSVGAFPLPFKLLVPEVHLAFPESLVQPRETVVRNAQHFLEEFLWFAQAMVEAKNIAQRKAVQ